ncbi:hypothetical protein GCM10007304_18030 [Rhodococcoides trifolii]|uniref:Uncharacterized protein n=1 Tax=Rhodococcoides trifolii TaxID=908250 RepID=A0A917CZZ9_9NOCA|nr:hypothetical protein GCM10007304_18030 [Rhodococcus trifolii]
MTTLDLDAIQDRADREHLTACPEFCGCIYLDDADRNDCACDGPCCQPEWEVDTAVLWRPERGERREDVETLIARIRELEGHNTRLHTAYVNAMTDGEGPR